MSWSRDLASFFLGFTIFLGLRAIWLQLAERSGPPIRTTGEVSGQAWKWHAQLCSHSIGKDLVTCKCFLEIWLPNWARAPFPTAAKPEVCPNLSRSSRPYPSNPSLLASPLCEWGPDAWFLDRETNTVALSRGGKGWGWGDEVGQSQRLGENKGLVNEKKCYSSKRLTSLSLFQTSQRTGLYGMEEGVCLRGTPGTLSARRWKTSMIQVRPSSPGDAGKGTSEQKDWKTHKPQSPPTFYSPWIHGF